MARPQTNLDASKKEVRSPTPNREKLRRTSKGRRYRSVTDDHAGFDALFASVEFREALEESLADANAPRPFTQQSR